MVYNKYLIFDFHLPLKMQTTEHFRKPTNRLFLVFVFCLFVLMLTMTWQSDLLENNFFFWVFVERNFILVRACKRQRKIGLQRVKGMKNIN